MTPTPHHALLTLQQSLLRRLDALTARLGLAPALPPHLATGIRGEEAALFHLRHLGYTIVAQRWTTPAVRGDVDLVAWHADSLCFIEVKTRTGRDLVPAAFAVDPDKQATLRRLARAYIKRFPEPRRSLVQARFDVVSVYFAPASGPSHPNHLQPADIEVLPAAFPRRPPFPHGNA